MYQEHNITKITTWPEALVPKIETTLPAFLLTRFWRTLEILCMNEIRTLLSIHCMLPRYSGIELHVNVTRRKLTCGTTSTTRTRTSECIFTTICTGTLVLQKKYLKTKSMTCYFVTIFADRKKKKEIHCSRFFTILRTLLTTTRRKTYPGALSILNKAEFCFVDSYQCVITLKLDYHFPPWPEDWNWLLFTWLYFHVSYYHS